MANWLLFLVGDLRGRSCIKLARLAGTGKVYLFTRSKEKFELAEKLGVDAALNPKGVNLNDFEFDLVINAVGSAQVVEDALMSLAKRGA